MQIRNILTDLTNNTTGYLTRAKAKCLNAVGKNTENIVVNQNRNVKIARRSSKKPLQNSNSQEKQVEIKQKNIEIEELEKSLDKDVSMLSISNDLPNFVFNLPTSDELKSLEFKLIYYKQFIERRNYNRSLIQHDKKSIESIYSLINFDEKIGDRNLLTVFDSSSDIEMNSCLLGKDFLSNSMVSESFRFRVINWLFIISGYLKVHVEMVQSAVGLFDRYLKIKGENLELNMIKVALISCWQISCKMRSDYLSYKIVSKVSKISQDDLVDMETEIFSHLHQAFILRDPQYFLKALSLTEQSREIYYIGTFFANISVIIYDLAAYPTHMRGAAAFCMAKHIWTGESYENSWTSILQFLTGLSFSDIEPIIGLLRTNNKNSVIQKIPYLRVEYEQIERLIADRNHLNVFNNNRDY